MVWSSSLINRNFISLALLIAIISAITYSFFTDIECKGMVCRGDFPAFYSAATLEASGNNLYNLELQKSIQNENWPSLKGRFLFFSYPPYVATLLSPLARLSPRDAKLTYLVLSILVYSIAMFTIYKYGTNQLSSLLINTILFAPTVVSLVSGQNLALSFLFLTIIYIALEKKNELLAGFAIGLWVFKPHFAIIALMGAIFSGLKKTSFVAITVFTFFYLLSAYKFGIYWPVEWLKTSSKFYEFDLIQNGHQMVSIASFFELYNLKFIGYFLGILLLICFLYLALTRSVITYINTLPAALILCSPHTMYYDMPLLFVPLLLKRKLDFSLIMLLIYILSYLYLLFRSNIILLISLILILILQKKNYKRI